MAACLASMGPKSARSERVQCDSTSWTEYEAMRDLCSKSKECVLGIERRRMCQHGAEARGEAVSISSIEVCVRQGARSSDVRLLRGMHNLHLSNAQMKLRSGACQARAMPGGYIYPTEAHAFTRLLR